MVNAGWEVEQAQARGSVSGGSRRLGGGAGSRNWKARRCPNRAPAGSTHLPGLQRSGGAVLLRSCERQGQAEQEAAQGAHGWQDPSLQRRTEEKSRERGAVRHAARCMKSPADMAAHRPRRRRRAVPRRKSPSSHACRLCAVAMVGFGRHLEEQASPNWKEASVWGLLACPSPCAWIGAVWAMQRFGLMLCGMLTARPSPAQPPSRLPALAPLIPPVPLSLSLSGRSTFSTTRA